MNIGKLTQRHLKCILYLRVKGYAVVRELSDYSGIKNSNVWGALETISKYHTWSVFSIRNKNTPKKIDLPYSKRIPYLAIDFGKMQPMPSWGQRQYILLRVNSKSLKQLVTATRNDFKRIIQPYIVLKSLCQLCGKNPRLKTRTVCRNCKDGDKWSINNLPWKT